MDNEIKSLIETQGKVFEEFKAANAELEAQVKKLGAADAVTEEKLAKMDAALHAAAEAKDAFEVAAKAEQKRIDDLEKRLNRPGALSTEAGALEAEAKAFHDLARSHAAKMNRPMPVNLTADDYTAYKSGFNAFVRGGKDALDEVQRKAMSVGSDPDGGYLVQADVTGRIVKKIYEMSPIRQIASVQQISTDALEGIIDNDEAGGMVMVNETTGPSTTSTPQIGKWRIPVFEGAVEPKVTQQLLEDAAVDVEAWLAAKVSDKIARGQNVKFITGNGVSEPRGFTTYTTAATSDASRAWGTLEHVATGVSSNFASSNPADKLFDLIGAFKDAYLQNARFVTRREVITLIRKFKESTTGQYLWQPGLQQGQPQSILGFPVTIAQDMPTLADGSLSMAFGDFAAGYQIVDRLGLSVIRDNLTSKPFVKFYTRVRFGGAVLNYEAIKFVKFGS